MTRGGSPGDREAGEAQALEQLSIMSGQGAARSVRWSCRDANDLAGEHSGIPGRNRLLELLLVQWSRGRGKGWDGEGEDPIGQLRKSDAVAAISKRMSAYLGSAADPLTF